MMTETVRSLFTKAAAYNPRTIDPADLAQLDKTLRELGSLDGIVLNRRTNTIVSGHQRLKVMAPDWKLESKPATDSAGTVALGNITAPDGRVFPYREVDWDIHKEKAANLAANHNAGTWDLQKQLDIISELVTAKYDLDLTGHNPAEIQQMFQWSDDDAQKLTETLSAYGGFEAKPAGYDESQGAQMAPSKPTEHYKLRELQNEDDAKHIMLDVKHVIRGDQDRWLAQQGAKVGLTKSDLVRQAIDLFKRHCEGELV